MTAVLPHIGAWAPGAEAPAFDGPALLAAAQRCRETAHLLLDPETGRVGVGFGGTVGGAGLALLATLPPLYPEWLGDRGFGEVHGTRFPYVVGAMANGIATARLVVEAARAGFIGFFGAAGLARERVEAGLDEIEAALGRDGGPWGSNLIHSPNEPDLERAVAELYVRRGVHRVSASAYMKLTPAIVRYAVAGLRQLPDGRIFRSNHVFAKISRPEVARHFVAPAPQAILDALVGEGAITSDEARLARQVSVAEDITVESDSGGHTDNQPLGALFPTICSVRDRAMAAHGFDRPIRVGAAGGIGTPQSVASAFALGAAYVLTGSVNQACIESGLSDDGRRMLAGASLADVTMAPAADMFELGVQVQVLQRGTMFANRAKRLYRLYRELPGLSALAEADRAWLEKDVLQSTVAEGLAGTEAFWSQRDPRENERAALDAKHQMALLFRSYLGQSSRWAIAGTPNRKADFQVWCGPAMGAFNDWTAGTFLAEPGNRTAVQVGRNLMEGAAVVTRAQQLRSYGAPVPPEAFDFRPRPLG